jgi:hypothetical protein
MFPKIREDIRKTKMITVSNDTGEHLITTGIKDNAILYSKSMSAQDETTVGVNARMSQYIAGRLYLREI